MKFFDALEGTGNSVWAKRKAHGSVALQLEGSRIIKHSHYAKEDGSFGGWLEVSVISTSSVLAEDWELMEFDNNKWTLFKD